MPAVQRANANATTKGSSVAKVRVAGVPSSIRRYYVGYALCGLIGGLVLAVVAFLLFLLVCDYLGIADPAGNSGALLVLVILELVFCPFTVPCL